MAVEKIKTIAKFAAALAKLPRPAKGCIRFFRGHPCYKKNRILPRLYRETASIENEQNFIQEAIIRCPADFSGLSFFEKLVKLQHYGLPTRLLDLTSNALAALYFACKDNEKTEGEIIVFDIPTDDVKYYDSDTVAVIANIARRKSQFDLSKLPANKEEFNEHDEIGRLVYDIQENKAAFRPLIEPSHLKRVLAVRAKLDNARIARQDGAFLLFGINGKKTECATIPDDWIICGNNDTRIIFSHKHSLKTELRAFGISEHFLFPELESQTQAIVAQFSKKYARKKKMKKAV
jgi:FRG domain